MSQLKGQDILIAIKLIQPDSGWTYGSLGKSVEISASQAHASVDRLIKSKMIDKNLRLTIRKNLLEFLNFGAKYMFPTEVGAVTKGIGTAHSAPVMKNRIVTSDQNLVWEHPKGKLKGAAVEPIYKTAPEIALKDSRLYAILAALDSIRLGKPREIEVAIKSLEESVYG
jgi:hypothetical protein